MNCQSDWLNQNIEHALNHFGRLTEPKKVMCDQAWYKYRDWQTSNHYFVNDLLGQRISITTHQYDDKNIITPNNLSQ